MREIDKICPWPERINTSSLISENQQVCTAGMALAPLAFAARLCFPDKLPQMIILAVN